MSEYYAVQRSEEYLEHYGIKGMKWGVRKAIERGNTRALGRQYKKAAKKLAKLEKRAASGKKYAKRAAAYGAGAALAGTVAIGGASKVTEGALKGTSKAMHGVAGAMRAGGKALVNSKKYGKSAKARAFADALNRSSKVVDTKASNVAVAGMTAGHNLKVWGKKNTISKKAFDSLFNASLANVKKNTKAGKALTKVTGRSAQAVAKANLSNDAITRIGAGMLGAGLGVAAARNAYKAATTKKAAQRASQFKREMSKAFAGTQYANGKHRQGNRKKRRT